VKSAGGRLGTRHVLIKQGFNQSIANTIRRIAAIDQNVFDKAIESPRPPSPNALRLNTADSSESWKLFGATDSRATQFRTVCRAHSARSVAAAMRVDEAKMARVIAVELIEWLDELERHLPKASS
jgi:hypothetical protein